MTIDQSIFKILRSSLGCTIDFVTNHPPIPTIEPLPSHHLMGVMPPMPKSVRVALAGTACFDMELLITILLTNPDHNLICEYWQW